MGDISYPCFDTFELGRFLLEREFDIGVVNSEKSRYSSFINLPSGIVDIVTSFISGIDEKTDSASEATNIYLRLKKHKLLPANYPRKSIFLVYIVCMDNSLAIDYVYFLLKRKENWPCLFIDNAIDQMTTQLNQSILRDDIISAKRICSLVGPNGVRDLNKYFTFRPYNFTRGEVEKKCCLNYFSPHPLRLERQLTNYGPERILNTYKILSRFIDMRVPIILASEVSRQIFDYMTRLGADVSGADEITGKVV
jgi:hypothetical protein